MSHGLHVFKGLKFDDTEEVIEFIDDDLNTDISYSTAWTTNRIIEIYKYILKNNIEQDDIPCIKQYPDDYYSFKKQEKDMCGAIKPNIMIDICNKIITFLENLSFPLENQCYESNGQLKKLFNDNGEHTGSSALLYKEQKNELISRAQQFLKFSTQGYYIAYDD